MKWVDLIARLQTLEAVPTGDEAKDALIVANLAAVRKAASKPALMSVLEGHYRSSMIKTQIKQKVDSCATELCKGALPQGNADMCRLVRHAIEQLATKSFASDQQVRRWGVVAAELKEDEDMVRVLSSVACSDTRLEALVRSSLHATLSDCNRRGEWVTIPNSRDYCE